MEAAAPPPPRIETIAEWAETSREPVVEGVEEDALLYEPHTGETERLIAEVPGTSDDIENEESRYATAQGPDDAIPATRETTIDVDSAPGVAQASASPPEADSEDEGRPGDSEEGPAPSQASNAALDPEGFRGRGFEDVALGVIPAQIAMLVRTHGRVAIGDLPRLYSERFGISVEESKAKWLIRFAWSAVGRKFARWNEEQTELLPGPETAHVLDPPGKWTFAEVETLARELHDVGIDESELFDRVISTVHPGKRAPRLIARLVGSAIYSATHRRSSDAS